MTNGIAEMGTFGGNVGPINTPVTGKGAVAGFDPIMKFSKRATKSRKKKESAGKQWEHRRDDPTYIDGRSKQARKLIKRLAKRKKKMSEEFLAISAFHSVARCKRNRNERSVHQTESKRSRQYLVLKPLTIKRKQRIDRRRLLLQHRRQLRKKHTKVV